MPPRELDPAGVARPVVGPTPPPFMRHVSDEGPPDPDEVEAFVAYLTEHRPDLIDRLRNATDELEHQVVQILIVGWWNMTVDWWATNALRSLPEPERDKWMPQPVTMKNQGRIAARAAQLRRRPEPALRPVVRGASRGGRRNVRTRRAKARAPGDGEGSEDPDLVGGAA